MKHRKKCIEEAHTQTSYCDWSVEAHTIDPLTLRPSGGMSVFRLKEDRSSTSSKETATHKTTSADLRSVNMSSSQAMALDANITQTVEDRVIS